MIVTIGSSRLIITNLTCVNLDSGAVPWYGRHRSLQDWTNQLFQQVNIICSPKLHFTKH